MEINWGLIIDRIQDESKRNVCKELGLRSQYGSDLRSGKVKNPGADFVLQLVQKFNLNPYWLISNGKGEMFANKTNDIKIQVHNIVREEEHTDENGTVFYWDTISSPADCLRYVSDIELFLNSFSSKGQKIKNLFMPYLEKDFAEESGFRNSDFGMKLQNICEKQGIILKPFCIKNNDLTKYDIDSVKKYLKLVVFPEVISLKPSHLWIALPIANGCNSFITHSLIGMAILDSYFKKMFPKSTLCKIEEEESEW